MYRLRIKITGEQRKALYEQVRNHLAGLGDVFVALECQKDYPTAERLAIEFGEDFRLMADLGNPEDGREVVAEYVDRGESAALDGNALTGSSASSGGGSSKELLVELAGLEPATSLER